MVLDPNSTEMPWSTPYLSKRPMDPELAKAARRLLGMTPRMMRDTAAAPWIGRATLAWRTLPLSLDSDSRDLTEFVCAQENGCRHCYGVARTMLAVAGFSRRRIAALEATAQDAEGGSRQAAVARFVRQLAQSNPRPARGEVQDLLSIGFSEREVGELAMTVFYNCFGNRVGTFFALPPEVALESLGKAFWGGLVRPMVRRRLLSIRRSKPGAWSAAGPYQAVVEALGDTDAARFVREILDMALSAPHLPARSKHLMIAVVARLLGCGYCEAESRRLAVTHGASQQSVEEAVATFASPGISQAEEKLLAFARDSVRYQVAPMQARAKALVHELGEEQGAEALGVAAVANGLVRLGMLVS
jgi:AhpD family alkylhydroperoxidase